MANVPTIPPASAPRPETPVCRAGRSPTLGHPSFSEHLQRSAGHPSAAALLGAPGLSGSARRSLGASSEFVSADVEGKPRRPETDSVDGSDDDRSCGHAGVDPLDDAAKSPAVDPMARALYGQLGALGLERIPPTAVSSAVGPPDAVAATSHVSLEHVMSRFVRRVAWSGDRHTGTARLEFGAGALSGATLTIHSDQGAVQVSLELPPGVDREKWRDRIARRLAASGLQVAALEVE